MCKVRIKTFYFQAQSSPLMNITEKRFKNFWTKYLGVRFSDNLQMLTLKTVSPNVLSEWLHKLNVPKCSNFSFHRSLHLSLPNILLPCRRYGLVKEGFSSLKESVLFYNTRQRYKLWSYYWYCYNVTLVDMPRFAKSMMQDGCHSLYLRLSPCLSKLTAHRQIAPFLSRTTAYHNSAMSYIEWHLCNPTLCNLAYRKV